MQLHRSYRIGTRPPPAFVRHSNVSHHKARATRTKHSVFSALTAFTLLALAPCEASVPVPPAAPPIPAGYCTTIANELTGDLQTFNTQLATPPTWTPVPGGPTLYAGTLSEADSDTGPQISGANYFASVQLQLQELKAMGIQAVSVPVGFPVLYEPFYGSQAALTPYLTFYTNVAKAVRGAGLKLIVDNEILFSNDIQAGWSNMNAFYSTLTWPQYIVARASMAATIEQYMQPDYLMLANEPDTEAIQTGQTNLNNPVDAALMISGEITAVEAEALTLGLLHGPQLGAGFGTWLPPSGVSSLVAYVTSYIALPLDYIDMHLIPVNAETENNFLGNTLTIASMAAAVGKPVAIGQAWLSKSLASEWAVLGDDVIRARNPFSFWAPLDAYFLQTLQALGNYTNMVYVAPDLPIYFFAYQTYGGTTANGGAANCTCTTASCSDYQIVQTENTLAFTAETLSQFTTTAFSYYDELVVPPDTAPPAAPATLTGTAGTAAANLSWVVSSDNVGIAGYNVYRCTPPAAGQPCTGVFLAGATTTTYTDSTLTSNTFYNYQVQAFDLANNLSPLSPTLSLLTPRTTADAATGLAATAVSPKEITLSWSAPSDTTGLNKYLIYSGTSASNLQQLGTAPNTTTAYTNLSLAPGTTYYYGIIAVEQGINAPMSAIASATTLPLPSPPNTVAGTPSTTSVVLTWQESLQPGGLPIDFYQIYEGTTPGNLTKGPTTTTTTYTIKSLTANTPYYFEVVAVDTSYNDSVPSDQITVTTLPLPAAPVNVVPTANSTTQVTLTWTENIPPGGLPIKYYSVFRGPSASNLTRFANSVSSPYVNTGLSQGTTYFYALEAVDSALDVSPMSTPVSVTTLAPPAAPVNVVATANSTTKVTVTWTENIPSGGLPIKYYYVFRGPSPTGLTNVATRTTAQYIDTTVVAGGTYYYAVEAVDTAMDVSAQSAPPVAVTTPAAPAAPVNVAATANSATQVTVTWTENVPTGGLPIKFYYIFRGTSPTSLTNVATRTTAQYVDTTVVAGATYYYAVEAVDNDLDTSPQSSPPVQVTTP
jgi:fibronectin type 3 domain-containing protein